LQSLKFEFKKIILQVNIKMKPIKIRFYDNDIEKFIGIHMTFSGAGGGGPEIELQRSFRCG
jgi:hypothetical protein